MVRSAKPASTPVVPPFVEKTFSKIYRLIYRLDQARRAHPKTTKLVLAGVSIGISHAVWSIGLEPLARGFGFSGSEMYDAYHIAVGVAHLIVSFLTYLILKAFLPLVLVAQRAIALEALGLVWVSTSGDIHSLVKWFLGGHPENEPIKLICMSGSTLFDGPNVSGDETALPLREWGKRGKLDVVMPVSSASNPTVRERHKRYSNQVKAESYSTIEALVHEIDDGKSFLRKHDDNKLTEHDILCMWRVVILRDVCLVQNYFPNVDGLRSDFAPIFVYRNTGKHSYYQMYAEMFDLVKKHPGVPLGRFPIQLPSRKSTVPARWRRRGR